MGFGFNFKDYNDRLTFKKPILKEVKQTLDEQDFAKAEIAKEKKQKLKKFKKKLLTRGVFAELTALEKFEEFLEFRKMRGYYDPLGYVCIDFFENHSKPLVLLGLGRFFRKKSKMLVFLLYV